MGEWAWERMDARVNTVGSDSEPSAVRQYLQNLADSAAFGVPLALRPIEDRAILGDTELRLRSRVRTMAPAQRNASWKNSRRSSLNLYP